MTTICSKEISLTISDFYWHTPTSSGACYSTGVATYSGHYANAVANGGDTRAALGCATCANIPGKVDNSLRNVGLSGTKLASSGSGTARLSANWNFVLGTFNVYSVIGGSCFFIPPTQTGAGYSNIRVYVNSILKSTTSLFGAPGSSVIDTHLNPGDTYEVLWGTHVDGASATVNMTYSWIPDP